MSAHVQTRARLCAALGLRVLVRGYQVHGAVVGHVHADLDRSGAKNGLGWRERQDAQPTFQAGLAWLA